jgi:mono/diheme cytochrome c family protein
MGKRFRHMLAVAGILGGLVAAAHAQTPPLLTDSLGGRDVYVAYCAPCHGLNADGQGAVAPALRVPPPDLTALARRNGGLYPRDRITAILAGPGGPDVSAAHGSTEMPIWGAIFRQLGDDAATARVRIDNLVVYLQSVQRQ